MHWETIASIIGAITGSISLLGVAYFGGYWKGGVDKDIRNIKALFEKYPLAELATMVKTLWDIYVLDALRKRPDLANHGSEFHLMPEGERRIPANIKLALEQFPGCNPNKTGEPWGYLVVKCLGINTIQKMAGDNDMSIQETVAILSIYLQKNHNSAH